MLAFALILGIVAVVMLVLAKRQHDRTRLPSAKVCYSDTGARNAVPAPLSSSRYRLTGKPDYLIRISSGLIPVELKSRPAPRSGDPFESHRMQVAVYCLLVEETYCMPVPYGEIHYLDRVVRVPNTPELQNQLLQIISEMRKLEGNDLPRNHRQPARCANCGFRGRCGQELYS